MKPLSGRGKTRRAPPAAALGVCLIAVLLLWPAWQLGRQPHHVLPAAPAGASGRCSPPPTPRKGPSLFWTFPAADRGLAAGLTPRLSARYSGSGNRLLKVVRAVTSNRRVHLAWTLCDPGNNILGTESDRAANNLRIITSGVGPSAAALDLTLEGPYLQVISQGPWSITISE